MFLNFLSFILEEDNINDPGTPGSSRESTPTTTRRISESDRKHDVVAPVSPVSPLTSTTFASPPISPSSLKVNEQKNSQTLPPKPKQGIILIVYQ